MKGRYGSDTLNRHLMYAVIFLVFIQLITHNDFVMVLSYILWGIGMYRMLSKKIAQRSKENEYYLNCIYPVTLWWHLIRRQIKDPKHRYFRCPKCRQLVRLPRHEGEITITCPKCHHKFDKRT